MLQRHLLPTTVLLAVSATAPLSAAATDGRISFVGSLSDTTCTIDGGPGSVIHDRDLAPTPPHNMSVTLPTLPKDALAKPGTRAGATHFSVVIGGKGQSGCANGKVAKLWWDADKSPQIDPTTGRLRNSGTASNVEVSLKNSAGFEMNLAKNTNPSTATITDNTATLNYTAEYVSSKGGATAGTIDTFVVYSLAYN